MGTMLTSSKITWLTERRDAAIAMLEVAEQTYEELLARRVYDSTLNTGEGSHRTKLVELQDAQKQIEILMARIDWLNRKIAGIGDIVNMNVRRKW